MVRINAQDSDDVDDESYSVQMDHKEIHNTPIEGTFLFSRASTSFFIIVIHDKSLKHTQKTTSFQSTYPLR